jgi:FMN phosphatase YigB (HAD superfamily)
MRIAFDLDNTLIRNDFDFPLAQATRPIFHRLLQTEPLRLGVRELFAFCRQQRWEVWVYTTSYRSPFYIKKMLWVYSLRADGIINQARHDKYVRVRSTKHPPTFGVDTLIDDSRGVQLEGQRFGFHVIQVDPANAAWVSTTQAQLLALATYPKSN